MIQAEHFRVWKLGRMDYCSGVWGLLDPLNIVLELSHVGPELPSGKFSNDIILCLDSDENTEQF